MRAGLVFALLPALWAGVLPHVARVAPLGGPAGTTVAVEFRGTGLAAVLGPHRVRLITEAGPANTRLFNVNQFPGVEEEEPVTAIELRPEVVHGEMATLADQDFLKFRGRAGERWVFDLQSMERGGFLECGLVLLDGAGREVAYNEDQDEYLESPRLAVTFPRDGEYTLKIDQYRGPQGASCEGDCGYQLQISRLPVVTGMSPLGARPGSEYRVTVHGEALEATTGAYLRRVRGAEHYRLTFPYTKPVDGWDGETVPVRAKRVRAGREQVEAMSLEIDADPATVDGVPLRGANRHPVQLRTGEPFHAWTLAAQLGLPAMDTVLELWSAEGKLLAEHDDLMSGQGTVIGNPDSSLYYLPRATEAATLVVRDRTERTGPGFAYRLHVGRGRRGFSCFISRRSWRGRRGRWWRLRRC